MLSAPRHMPAITVVSFGDGLADPDLILGAGIQTLSANIWSRTKVSSTSAKSPYYSDGSTAASCSTRLAASGARRAHWSTGSYG